MLTSKVKDLVFVEDGENTLYIETIQTAVHRSWLKRRRLKKKKGQEDVFEGRPDTKFPSTIPTYQGPILPSFTDANMTGQI